MYRSIVFISRFQIQLSNSFSRSHKWGPRGPAYSDLHVIQTLLW